MIVVLGFQFFMICFSLDLLHLFSFKSPASRAEMNEEGDADCAFSMRNCVNKIERKKREIIRRIVSKIIRLKEYIINRM